jgi:hypothetical protein
VEAVVEGVGVGEEDDEQQRKAQEPEGHSGLGCREIGWVQARLQKRVQVIVSKRYVY